LHVEIFVDSCHLAIFSSHCANLSIDACKGPRY
jgi:hypothetical protein